MTAAWKVLEECQKQVLINAKFLTVLEQFRKSYAQATSQTLSEEKSRENFERLVDLVVEQIRQPYTFEVFHQSQRSPIDFYQFGLDFVRPLIDFKRSQVMGLEKLERIQMQLQNKENVILFANHQTEPDPQIISLMLKNIAPQLAREMIFVAGHRVIKDPLAIPLSRGCNLLCIYSKKHPAISSEDKSQKILHNQRTMKKMQELLREGGYCIYVAPSGGRDRRNQYGNPTVAPFDAPSIEFFWLMTQHCPSTHFYPLALKTYQLMPPPDRVEMQLGEERHVNFTPVYLAFGEEIDMDHFGSQTSSDKKTRQIQRCTFIWDQVCALYHSFP